MGSRDFLPPSSPIVRARGPGFLSPADSGGMTEGQGEGEGVGPWAAGGSRGRGLAVSDS